jgi:hypothetical protein
MKSPLFAAVETSSVQRGLAQKPCPAHSLDLWVDVLDVQKMTCHWCQQLMPEAVGAEGSAAVVMNPPV